MRSSVRHSRLIKSVAFAAFAAAVFSAIGLASVASAAISPARIASGNQSVILVAEKCGAGWYRYGPDKRCHKFDTSYGSNRGTDIACPPGMHIGKEGVYCWPN
jgi:hypothetical protein